ncbi:MAG: hypothetical protein ACKOGA_22510, partial [Planctomycetaceae bacterium]
MTVIALVMVCSRLRDALGGGGGATPPHLPQETGWAGVATPAMRAHLLATVAQRVGWSAVRLSWLVGLGVLLGGRLPVAWGVEEPRVITAATTWQADEELGPLVVETSDIVIDGGG